jgi:hypothetical protein
VVLADVEEEAEVLAAVEEDAVEDEVAPPAPPMPFVTNAHEKSANAATSPALIAQARRSILAG